MKNIFKVIFIFVFFQAFLGCTSKKVDIPSPKIEIEKVSFIDGKETFDKAVMKVEKTLTIDDDKLKQSIFKDVLTLVGAGSLRANLSDYNVYHVKVFHNNEQITSERWLLRLDKDFSEGGFAENYGNPGLFKIIDKNQIKEFEKILK